MVIILVVLELKDYTKNKLYNINRDEWTIRNTYGHLSTEMSPLIQVRDYAGQIIDV